MCGCWSCIYIYMYIHRIEHTNIACTISTRLKFLRCSCCYLENQVLKSREMRPSSMYTPIACELFCTQLRRKARKTSGKGRERKRKLKGENYQSIKSSSLSLSLSLFGFSSFISFASPLSLSLFCLTSITLLIFRCCFHFSHRSG